MRTIQTQMVSQMQRADVASLSSLASALSRLGDQIPDEEAVAAAQLVVRAMERPTSTFQLGFLGGNLGRLVETLDDETLVNMVAQVSPFDTVAKQALLEAPTIEERSELLIQFMQFFRMHQQSGGDDRATLQ